MLYKINCKFLFFYNLTSGIYHIINKLLYDHGGHFYDYQNQNILSSLLLRFLFPVTSNLGILTTIGSPN